MKCSAINFPPWILKSHSILERIFSVFDNLEFVSFKDFTSCEGESGKVWIPFSSKLSIVISKIAVSPIKACCTIFSTATRCPIKGACSRNELRQLLSCKTSRVMSFYLNWGHSSSQRPALKGKTSGGLPRWNRSWTWNGKWRPYPARNCFRRRSQCSRKRTVIHCVASPFSWNRAHSCNRAWFVTTVPPSIAINLGKNFARQRPWILQVCRFHFTVENEIGAPCSVTVRAHTRNVLE